MTITESIEGIKRLKDDVPKSRVLVNLGCGARAHSDWINIDYSLAAKLHWLPIVGSLSGPLPPGYVNWNLRRGIPFPSNSVDVVYASHLLEHIDHSESPKFVAEVRRVLKPGGVARLVVPDLETAAQNYLGALNRVRSAGYNSDAVEAHDLSTILLLDQMVRRELGGELARWLRAHPESAVVSEKGGIIQQIAKSKAPLENRGRLTIFMARTLGLLDPVRRGEVHRWMYDEVSMSELLRHLGFREITRVGPSESQVEGWASFALDTDVNGSPHHPDSLWIEAIK